MQLPDNVLFLDFETYSEVNLKDRGGMNYATHPSTQIVCMGYAFNNEKPKLWTPKDADLPLDIKTHVEIGGLVYAHNMTFDFRIWNYVGHCQMGWPALSLDQCVDTMALCQCFQLPASLDQAGEALGITMPKDKNGKALIKLCCVPMSNGQQPTPWGPLAQKFIELYEYCKRDIVAMRQIVAKLPRKVLIPREQEIWQLTYEMNSQGLPVDAEAIEAIKVAIEEHVAEATLRIPRLCDGMFQTMGQVAKIRAWCEMNGYVMDSLDAATVAAGLKDPDCPEKVKRVLEARQELGSSSTAKYKKLFNLIHPMDDNKAGIVDPVINDNVVYHGAGTGRWAGRGFQVHNLPRASVEAPETYISCFVCEHRKTKEKRA